MNGMESPLVHKNFVARNYEVAIQDIEMYGHRVMFELLEATTWIEKHRMPRYGQLDVAATAQVLGIPVVYDPEQIVSGIVYGIPGSRDKNRPLVIGLHPEDVPDEEHVTFGHEVGHVFLGLVAGLSNENYSREVEHFCELFGREMALPRRELTSIINADEPAILSLMETYGTDLDTTLMQLIEAGKLPKKLVVLTKVPADSKGKHAAQVAEDVVCFDCRENEYQSCAPGQKDFLPRLDLFVTEDAYKLRSCGNEKHWMYDSEDSLEILQKGEEPFWGDLEEPF